MNTWTRRNYRKQLIAGIRARIENAHSWSRLLLLYSFLMDAGELDS